MSDIATEVVSAGNGIDGQLKLIKRSWMVEMKRRSGRMGFNAWSLGEFGYFYAWGYPPNHRCPPRLYRQRPQQLQLELAHPIRRPERRQLHDNLYDVRERGCVA